MKQRKKPRKKPEVLLESDIVIAYMKRKDCLKVFILCKA